MWWQDGVLYQIYPRSWLDSNGDGVGDLKGIFERLDHLEWLGVDGIWLNPTMPSPNDDWGYDVADYCAVHPDLGTMEDLRELVEQAGRRGTRFLYYGDEIGMAEVPIGLEEALDPVPRRTGDPDRGRDGCRTPMQWTPAPGAGFTPDGARPWLPLGDVRASNVADQRADRGSVLHLVRDLIALRRERPDLQRGGYRTLPAPAGAWAWRRGSDTAVAINLSDGEAGVGGAGRAPGVPPQLPPGRG